MYASAESYDGLLNMFTGIIESIGTLVRQEGHRFWIRIPYRNVRKGESIGVDGVCLTVAAKRGKLAAFDIGAQTQKITTLGTLACGQRVNLERALRYGDRLGGHWVSGHVDNVGRITRIAKGRQSWWFTFRLPSAVRGFVVPRASLAVDGISLTAAIVRGRSVSIMIIPHTLSHTTLADKKVGDPVNLEPDLMAKYALAYKRPGVAAHAFLRALRRAGVPGARG